MELEHERENQRTKPSTAHGALMKGVLTFLLHELNAYICIFKIMLLAIYAAYSFS